MTNWHSLGPSLRRVPPIRDDICVSSQCRAQWKGNRTEKGVLTYHQTPDPVYPLCSRKNSTYFYKMPCVLKVLFISVPISRKTLLFLIGTFLGLLLVKGGHRDFHLWQSASSTLSVLFSPHSHVIGMPLIFLCSLFSLFLLSFLFMHTFCQYSTRIPTRET